MNAHRRVTRLSIGTIVGPVGEVCEAQDGEIGRRAVRSGRLSYAVDQRVLGGISFVAKYCMANGISLADNVPGLQPGAGKDPMIGILHDVAAQSRRGWLHVGPPSRTILRSRANKRVSGTAHGIPLNSWPSLEADRKIC